MENYNARVKDLGYYVGTNFGEFIKKNKENGSLSELEDDTCSRRLCPKQMEYGKSQSGFKDSELKK